MFGLLLGTLLAFAEVQDEAIALDEAPLFEPPSQEEVEQRTYALGKILRCPVCQGLSVADSQSDAAVAMKNRIQELVALGYADEQIIDYFVGRYGEFVLLQPKSEHWFVWMAPVAGLVIGLGAVAIRWRSSGATEEVSETRDAPVESTGSESAEEKDAYRAQILAELED
jgi:cytochrome c-type biogenesis protein CcmH